MEETKHVTYEEHRQLDAGQSPYDLSALDGVASIFNVLKNAVEYIGSQ